MEDYERYWRDDENEEKEEDVFIYKRGRDISSYTKSAKLPKGRTITIEFTEYKHPSKIGAIVYYHVYLFIKHKRKHEVMLKQTGKCGITGLLWAKEQMIKFGELISEKHPGQTKKIIVNWDDNRRRRVYEKGLLGLGYEFEFVFEKKALVKKIK